MGKNNKNAIELNSTFIHYYFIYAVRQTPGIGLIKLLLGDYKRKAGYLASACSLFAAYHSLGCKQTE